MAFNLTANLNVALNTGALRAAANQLNSALNTNTQLKLGIDRNSLSGLKQIKTQIAEATDSMENFGRQAGFAAKRFLAFSVTAGSMITFISTMKEAVSAAVDFDREMIRLRQVSSDTAQDVLAVGDQITNLSKNLGVSSKDLIGVAVVLKQANLSLSETKDALEAMAQAALAPNFDNLKDTTEGAIAIMKQFKVEARDLGSALGSVNAVAGEFAVEASDIIEAIRKTGGAFKAAGGNLNELIALFTSVRQTTRESAESIGTGLRTIFTRIQRNDTANALREVGINLRYTANEARALGDAGLENQFVGPYEAIKRLSAGLSELRSTDPRFSAIVEQLGGYRQISKVIPLIQEFATAQKALGVAQAGSVSLAVNAGQAQDALAVKLQKLKESFFEVGRSIVNSPGFRGLTDTFISAATSVLSLINSLKGLLPLITAISTIKLFQGIGSFAKGFVSGASSDGRPIAKKEMGGFIKMQKGGIVPGSGSGDIVPALLEPGELVVPRQKFGIGGKTTVDLQTLPYKRHRIGKNQNINFNKIVFGLNKGKKIGFLKFEEEALKELGGAKGKGRTADPNFPIDGILSDDTPVEVRNRISTTSDSVLASKLIGYKEYSDPSFFEKIKNGKLKSIGKIALVYNTGKLKRSEEYKKALENKTIEFKEQQKRKNKFFGGSIQKFVFGGLIHRQKFMEGGDIEKEYEKRKLGSRRQDTFSRDKSPNKSIETINKLKYFGTLESFSLDQDEEKNLIRTIERQERNRKEKFAKKFAGIQKAKGFYGRFKDKLSKLNPLNLLKPNLKKYSLTGNNVEESEAFKSFKEYKENERGYRRYTNIFGYIQGEREARESRSAATAKPVVSETPKPAATAKPVVSETPKPAATAKPKNIQEIIGGYTEEQKKKFDQKIADAKQILRNAKETGSMNLKSVGFTFLGKKFNLAQKKKDQEKANVKPLYDLKGAKSLEEFLSKIPSNYVEELKAKIGRAQDKFIQTKNIKDLKFAYDFGDRRGPLNIQLEKDIIKFGSIASFPWKPKTAKEKKTEALRIATEKNAVKKRVRKSLAEERRSKAETASSLNELISSIESENKEESIYQIARPTKVFEGSEQYKEIQRKLGIDRQRQQREKLASSREEIENATRELNLSQFSTPEQKTIGIKENYSANKPVQTKAPIGTSPQALRLQQQFEEREIGQPDIYGIAKNQGAPKQKRKKKTEGEKYNLLRRQSAPIQERTLFDESQLSNIGTYGVNEPEGASTTKLVGKQLIAGTTRPEVFSPRFRLRSRAKQSVVSRLILNERQLRRRIANENLEENLRSLRFAGGGLVPGTGNSDTVPMDLPEGSFVIRKSSVNKIGADNLAKAAKFASGGTVPALLTPGEYVYSPKEANKIGSSRLNSMNKFAKFAGGGPIGLARSGKFDPNDPKDIEKLKETLEEQIRYESPNKKESKVQIEVKQHTDEIQRRAQEYTSDEMARQGAESRMTSANALVGRQQLKVNTQQEKVNLASDDVASASKAKDKYEKEARSKAAEEAKYRREVSKQQTKITSLTAAGAAPSDPRLIAANAALVSATNSANAAMREKNRATNAASAADVQLTKNTNILNAENVKLAQEERMLGLAQKNAQNATNSYTAATLKAEKSAALLDEYQQDAAGKVLLAGKVIGETKPLSGKGSIEGILKKREKIYEQESGRKPGKDEREILKSELVSQYRESVGKQLRAKAEKEGKPISEISLQASVEQYTQEFASGKRRGTFTKEGGVTGDKKIGQSLSKGGIYEATGDLTAKGKLQDLGYRAIFGSRRTDFEAGPEGQRQFRESQGQTVANRLTTLAVGANLFGTSIKERAGTGEGIVSKGEGDTVKVNESLADSFKSSQAFGQSISSASTYAASAAQSLAQFGPVVALAGAGLSGIVGAFEGYHNGIKEAEAKIREAKIGQALNNLQNIFERVSNGLLEVNDSTLRRISENQSVLTQENQTKAYEESGGNASTIMRGLFKLTGGVIGNDVSQEKYNETLSKSRKETEAAQLVPLTNVLNKFSQDIGKDAALRIKSTGGDLATTNFEDIRGGLLEKLRSSGGGAGKEQIARIASAQNITMEEAEKQFIKTLQESFQAEKIKNITTKSIQENSKAINSMEALSNAVSSAAAAADSFSSKLDTNAALFEGGIGSTKLTSFSEKYGGTTPDFSVFNAAITESAGILGSYGQQFKAQGNAVNVATQILPDILSNSVENPISGKDISTQITDALKEGLKQRGITGAAAEQVVSSVSGKVSAEEFTKLLAEAGGDVSKASKKLISDISGPLVSAFNEIDSKLTDAGNKYISGLEELAKRQKAIGDQIGRLSELRSRSRSFMANEIQRLPGVQQGVAETINLQGARQDFSEQQQRLTGFGAGTAENPAAIASRLAKTQEQIRAQEQKVQATNKSTAGGAEFRNAALELTRLKSQASNLNDALKNLTDQSKKLEAAQAKLAQVRQGIDEKRSLGRKLLTQSPEEQQKMLQGQQLFNIVKARGGSVAGLSTEQNAVLFDFLDNFGSAGKKIADQILDISGYGAGKDDMSEEKKLVAEQARIFAQQEQAQRQIISNQQSLQEDYFSNLDSRNEKFYSELQKFIQEIQKNQLISEKLGKQQEISKIKDVQKEGKFLGAAGFNTKEDFDKLSTYKGQVVALAKSKQEEERIKGLGGVDFKGKTVNNVLQNPLELEAKLSQAGYRSSEAEKIRQLTQEQLNTGNKSNPVEQAIKLFKEQKLTDIGKQKEKLQGEISGSGAEDKLNNLINRLAKNEVSFEQFDRATASIKELQLTAGQGLTTAADAATERLNALNTQINQLGGVQVQPSAPVQVGAFAVGGSVFKPRGSDTVPAMLTPGEFVVNKNATQKNLPLLQSINSGKTSYFSIGGIAGAIAQPYIDEDEDLSEQMMSIEGQISAIKAAKFQNLLDQATKNAPIVLDSFDKLKSKYEEGKSTVTALGERGSVGTFFSNIFDNRNLLTTALQQMGGWGGIAGDYSTYIANLGAIGNKSLTKLQALVLNPENISNEKAISDTTQLISQADSTLTSSYNQIAPQGRDMPISPTRMLAIMDVIDGKNQASGSVNVSGAQQVGNAMVGAGVETLSLIGPGVALNLYKTGKLASIASKIPGLSKLLKAQKAKNVSKASTAGAPKVSTVGAETYGVVEPTATSAASVNAGYVASEAAAARAAAAAKAQRTGARTKKPKAKPGMLSQIWSGVLATPSTVTTSAGYISQYGAQVAGAAAIMSGGTNYFPSKPDEQTSNKTEVNLDKQIKEYYEGIVKKRQEGAGKKEKFSFNADILDAIGSYAGFEGSKNINVWKQNSSFLKVQELYDILTQKLEYDPVAPDDGTNLISSVAIGMKSFDLVSENLNKQKEDLINSVLAKKTQEGMNSFSGFVGNIKERYLKFQKDEMEKKVKSHNILMREGRFKTSKEIQSEIDKGKSKQKDFVSLGLAAKSATSIQQEGGAVPAEKSAKLAKLQDAYFLGKSGNASDMASIFLQRQAQAQTILGVLQTYQEQPTITPEEFKKIDPTSFFTKGENAATQLVSQKKTGISQETLSKLIGPQKELISSYLTLKSFQDSSLKTKDDFIKMVDEYTPMVGGDPQAAVDQIVKKQSAELGNDISNYPDFVKANIFGKTSYVKLVKESQKYYNISNKSMKDASKRGINIIDRLIEREREFKPKFVKYGQMLGIPNDQGVGFVEFNDKKDPYEILFSDSLFQSVIPSELNTVDFKNQDSILNLVNEKEINVDKMMNSNQFLSLFNQNGVKTISRNGNLGFPIDKSQAYQELLNGGLFQISSFYNEDSKDWKRFANIGLVENEITKEKIAGVYDFIRNYKNKIQPNSSTQESNLELLNKDIFGITEEGSKSQVGIAATDFKNYINDQFGEESNNIFKSIDPLPSKLKNYFKFASYASLEPANIKETNFLLSEIQLYKNKYEEKAKRNKKIQEEEDIQNFGSLTKPKPSNIKTEYATEYATENSQIPLTDKPEDISSLIKNYTNAELDVQERPRLEFPTPRSFYAESIAAEEASKTPEQRRKEQEKIKADALAKQQQERLSKFSTVGPTEGDLFYDRNSNKLRIKGNEEQEQEYSIVNDYLNSPTYKAIKIIQDKIDLIKLEQNLDTVKDSTIYEDNGELSDVIYLRALQYDLDKVKEADSATETYKKYTEMFRNKIGQKFLNPTQKFIGGGAQFTSKPEIIKPQKELKEGFNPVEPGSIGSKESSINIENMINPKSNKNYKGDLEKDIVNASINLFKRKQFLVDDDKSELKDALRKEELRYYNEKNTFANSQQNKDYMETQVGLPGGGKQHEKIGGMKLDYDQKVNEILNTDKEYVELKQKLYNLYKEQSKTPTNLQNKSRGGLINYLSDGGVPSHRPNPNTSFFKPKGTDTVPAMLTPGEFVINAAATAKHGELLHAINSGQDVDYSSTGGLISYLAYGGSATGMSNQLDKYGFDKKYIDKGDDPQKIYEQNLAAYDAMRNQQSERVAKIFETINLGYKFFNGLLDANKKEGVKRVGDIAAAEGPKELGYDTKKKTKPIQLAKFEKQQKEEKKEKKISVMPLKPPENTTQGGGGGGGGGNNIQSTKPEAPSTSPGEIEEEKIRKQAKDNLFAKKKYITDKELKDEIKKLKEDNRIIAEGMEYATQLEMATLSKGGEAKSKSDTIPAMLTPGEFVVNARSSSKNASLLHAINSGKEVEGFAQGGVVGYYAGGKTSGGRPSDRFTIAANMFSQGVSKFDNLISKINSSNSSNYINIAKSSFDELSKILKTEIKISSEPIRDFDKAVNNFGQNTIGFINNFGSSLEKFKGYINELNSVINTIPSTINLEVVGNLSASLNVDFNTQSVYLAVTNAVESLKGFIVSEIDKQINDEMF